MKIINLLPKEKQKELAQRRLLLVITSLMWFSAASFLIVLLAQFGVRAFLTGQAARLNASIEGLKAQTTKEDNAAVKTEVKQLNDLVTDYKNLSASVPKLSRVIQAFTEVVPESVRITALRIDAQKKLITVNGYSPTRERVIEFYENVLKDSKNFPNIDYPLENVAKQTDINFHFTFNVNDELLK